MSGQRELRFAIIGAGMSGILSAIKLNEAGLTNYAIYEKTERLGGTWRENTYPGVACDVPSHLYTYSFEPNPGWTQHFASGGEIQKYFEGVASKYGVDKQIQYGQELARAEFRDGRWQLEMKSGLRDQADVVIAATGVLHHPSLPEIAGLGSFKGACFHSARWDHRAKLDGARVGVIGTGSTAVQIVSALVDRVAKISVFQRTPQWVMAHENLPYSEAERENFRRNPQLLREMHANMSNLFAGMFANAVVDANSAAIQAIEAACLANLENNVKDPVLREKLRPNYRAACKRLIFSPDFYTAIQKPNAELVTDAIERIEPAGVRTKDGRLHELDVLVLATGFRVDRFMRPAQIVGRGGLSLDEAWAKRPSAYLAISIPDFPNLFMLNGPNGPVGNFSLIEVAELQFGYILQLVEQLRSGACREISPKRDVTERYEAERSEAAKNSIWTTGCRSWYLDDRGIPGSWPWPFDRFRAEMARPKLESFDCAR